ncbi:hypothetical protein SAMN06272765_2895 [Streptomyces sp. Ag109_G2-15]|nr:hypothetical protein SAMN06272765_2895 [Streptomyces sp. Ag109_G2-15]
MTATAPTCARRAMRERPYGSQNPRHPVGAKARRVVAGFVERAG